MHSRASSAESQLRRESAFISNRGGESAFLQDILQGVKNFRPVAQSFRKSRRPFRHDHEFLKIDGRVGMSAAIQDVHHRYGQYPGIGAAQITEEREAAGNGRSMSCCEGNPEQRVGAESFLIRCSIEFDNPRIDLRLIGRIHAGQRRADDFVHVANSLRDSLATVTLLVAIAKFPRLVLTGAGAARNSGASHCAPFEVQINFDRWIPA